MRHYKNYYLGNREELLMGVNDRVEFLEYQNKGKKGTTIKFA